MTQSVQHAGSAVGEQFYVTHCTTSDSVLNNPGYTVRAASERDADLLDAAFHYPPYELPIDMWKDLPQPDAAPCRLARTEHADERGVWAVHSSYLAKDTVDRDRSYFSHLLLLPSAEPEAVLRSWGAAGWVRSYPQGADKELKRETARLPVGTLVSDAALTAFLNDPPTGPTQLSVAVCPARLRGPVAERRELLARMLQAVLLLATEENDARRRLYIHAEPGLIALLLYGAVRLLPKTATDNLTFSTFEPYHRNFRDYKLAEVVGTYLGTPEKGLDTDLGTTRGIAWDTFHAARSSPELRLPPPAGISDLVELATRGEWELLPTVRHALGADPSGLAKAGKALHRARGLARVDAGNANIDELLALQEDKLAAEELKTRPEKFWPVVKAAALDPRRAEVRKAFSELLAHPDRVKELWEEAFKAVLEEDFRTWESRWSVIRAAVGPAEARKLLNKRISSDKSEDRLAKLPTDVRNKLRAACIEVSLMPPRPLLVPIGLGELEPLLNAPADCAGYTAFVLMGKDELGWLNHIPAPNRVQMRKRAREFILNAPAVALASYVRAARPYLDTDTAFLDVLFTPFSPRAAGLMDKLLTTTTLEPGDWRKLCDSIRLTQDAWGEYLLEQDHLASLLVGLGGDGIGKDVWEVYLDSLTPALISPDLIEAGSPDDAHAVHEWERKVHGHLRIAAERLTKANVKLAPALPEGGVARLFAANFLLKWVDDPASAERDGPDEVKNACLVFQVEPHDLVRVAYHNGGFKQFNAGAEPKELAPIVALFRACFPVDAEYNTSKWAAREAVRLSRECPEKTRGAFQALLIHSCVPEMHYQAIRDDTWQEPLHPYTIARLSEWINRAAKKPGPKYVPSTATGAEATPVEDTPFANDEENSESFEPEPVIQKKTGTRSSKRGYSAKRRRDGSKLWLWVVLLLMVAGAVGLGVVVVKKLGDKPAPQTEQKAK